MNAGEMLGHRPCLTCGGDHATIDCTWKFNGTKQRRRILVRYTPDPGRYIESQIVDVGTSQGVVFTKDMTDAQFDETVAFMKRQGHDVTVVEGE